MARHTDTDDVDLTVLAQAAKAPSAVQPVTGRRPFEVEVLEADLPVVVDFWAPGCAPCASMSAVLVALAPLYDGKLKLVKVNLAENVWAAERYAVKSVPLLLPFLHGVDLADLAILGACTRGELVRRLDRIVKHCAD